MELLALLLATELALLLDAALLLAALLFLLLAAELLAKGRLAVELTEIWLLAITTATELADFTEMLDRLALREETLLLDRLFGLSVRLATELLDGLKLVWVELEICASTLALLATIEPRPSVADLSPVRDDPVVPPPPHATSMMDASIRALILAAQLNTEYCIYAPKLFGGFLLSQSDQLRAGLLLVIVLAAIPSRNS